MAAGWLAWELTESTSWLGIVAFADALPMVVLSIFAGAIGDRMVYLRVIRASQLGTSCVAALFAGLTLGTESQAAKADKGMWIIGVVATHPVHQG